jgi:hypothetical protein
MEFNYNNLNKEINKDSFIFYLYYDISWINFIVLSVRKKNKI